MFWPPFCLSVSVGKLSETESCPYPVHPLLYADCMFKSGSRCVDCLPSHNGHCSNHGLMISADCAQDNGEHSQTLSMPKSAAIEAITEDSPESVAAMLDDMTSM